MWTSSYGTDTALLIVAAVATYLGAAAVWLWSSKRTMGRPVGSAAGRIGNDIAASSIPSSDQPDLLRLRLEVLRIDANELARLDPVLLGKLHRICAKCASRGACALDLAHPSSDVAWGEWRDYCPNAARLNELRVRSVMRSTTTPPDEEVRSSHSIGTS